MNLSTYKNGIELTITDASEQLHFIFKCDLFPGPTKTIDVYIHPRILNQQLSLGISFNENELAVAQQREGHICIYPHPAIEGHWQEVAKTTDDAANN